jgi:hypothetical protein
MAPFLSGIEGRPTAPNYITAAISGRFEHAWPIDDDVVAARWYDLCRLAPESGLESGILQKIHGFSLSLKMNNR